MEKSKRAPPPTRQGRRSCNVIDYQNEYRNLAEARSTAFWKGVYNQRRLHSAFGYLTPVEFERNLTALNHKEIYLFEESPALPLSPRLIVRMSFWLVISWWAGLHRRVAFASEYEAQPLRWPTDFQRTANVS